MVSLNWYLIVCAAQATTIALTNGVPIESVSKMFLHNNLRTTHYAKILDKKVSEDMKILRDKFITTSKNNKILVNLYSLDLNTKLKKMKIDFAKKNIAKSNLYICNIDE